MRSDPAKEAAKLLRWKEFEKTLMMPGLPEALFNHSASQLKTFDLCERKWVLENLYKLRPPETLALKLGTALHKQIEDWYLLGIVPPSLLAQAGLKNCPPKGSGLIAIEKSLTDPSLKINETPFFGFIDLIFQPVGVTDWVRIIDHKSTKGLGWAKSEKDLETDIQMGSYAHWAFEASPELERVEAWHNYLDTTSTATTLPVPSQFTRPQARDLWETKIVPAAQAMQGISVQAVESKDIDFFERATPNEDSCNAFGGCKFKPLCDSRKKISPPGRFFAGLPTTPTNNTPNTPTGNKNMALSELLKKNVAVASTAVAAKPAGLGALAPKTAAPPAGATATSTLQTARQARPAMPVIPPDAPKEMSPVATVAAGNEASDDLTDDSAPEGGLVAEVVQAPSAEAPKPRGRPRKDAAAATVVAVAPPVNPTPAGFTLCIHCLPVMTAETSVSLELILANLSEKIAKQMSIANLHGLDYAKKVSLLSEALKAYPLTSSVYTFTSSDSLLEAVISSTLSNRAALVIRGIR